MRATVHQTIPTGTMVARLPTAGTRRHQPRDGGIGAQALQVQRGRGRISNLSGSGCSPSGRGGFGGIRSMVQYQRAGHRPTLKIHTPVNIPSGHWLHVTKEVPNVLAGAARPTGLRVYGKERLNHPTSTKAAIVVSSRYFIYLQLLILRPSCRRVYGGGDLFDMLSRMNCPSNTA